MPGTPDNDGDLAPTDAAFQEGGMHVEGFWVRNSATSFDAQGHLHVIYPNALEQSHGYATVAGLGPDRQGVFLRREDGGPFDLQSLDYRLLQPAATNLRIGTSYDPSLPVTAQLTAFPVTTNAGFQTLAPGGFDGVTQLFIVWDLGVTTADRAEIDNIRIRIPPGSCSPSTPSGVVFSHAGQLDPASEGFTVEGAGTNVTAFPLNDGGVDAWAVDDNGTGAGSSRFYTRNLPPDVMCWARTAGATLRTRVRVADVPDSADGGVLASYTDGQRLWELRLGAGATGAPVVQLAGAYLALSTLGSGYHTYELVYDPSTATVDLFVDGVERISNRAGNVQSVSAPRLRFGSQHDSGAGQGNFASVEFELPAH
jgi:hypothetical protein